MADTVYPGRFTARVKAPYVVFLIGFRINRLFAVRKWTQVMRAMPPMLKELAQHPEYGNLSSEYMLNWRGGTVLQYWKSFDHLHRYSLQRDAAHLPAWAAFNRSIGNDGTVGVWHETYLIDPNRSESIYVNMPSWGLSRAFDKVAVTGVNDNARQRVESSPKETINSDS